MGIDLVLKQKNGDSPVRLFPDETDIYPRTALREMSDEERECFNGLGLERLYDHPVINCWTSEQVGKFLDEIRRVCPGGVLEKYFCLLVEHELEILVF